MLLILIFILVFASVTLLSWQLYPAGVEAVGNYQSKLVARDTERLEKMFLKVPGKKLMLAYIFSPLVLGVLAFVFAKNLSAALIGGVFGVVLPAFVIKMMEMNRNRKFTQQLVDGLMVLATSLKGGLSLLQSIAVIVEEMPPPISQEFALVLRENKMGVPLNESLERMNARMNSEELNLAVTAIDVARETGGNLVEPLERLMVTIREKDKLMGKIKGLTLQGKLQGVIMSLMPIIFGIVVYYLNPGFLELMGKHPYGRIALMAAGGLEIIGAFLLWKFSKVEV